MSRIQPASSNPENKLFYAFLFFLGFIALPFGSVQNHFAFLLVCFCCILAIAFCAIRLLQPTKTPDTYSERALTTASPVILLLLFSVSWHFFQTILLDAETLSVLSENRLLHNGMGMHENEQNSISFYLAGSHKNLMLSCAYLMVFVLSLLLLNNRQRLYRLLYTLVAIGVIQSIYGSINVLTGQNTTLGFEKPDTYFGHATGTLFNYNHFANLITFSAAAAVGLLLSKPAGRTVHTWRQWLRETIAVLLDNKLVFRISLTLIVIALVLSKSRMGNSAFFFSLTTSGLIWLAFTGKVNRGFFVLFGSMLVIDVLIISHWFGLMQLVERFENTDIVMENRVQALPFLTAMFEDFKWSGIGSGGFEYLFPLYNEMGTDKFFNAAHNDYLQFLIELGLIGFIPLLLAVLTSFGCALYTLRKRRSVIFRACAFTSIMAMLACGMHAITDFNFQIPSNATYFMVIMALPWAALNCERKKRVKKRRKKQTTVEPSPVPAN